ncbi:alkylated DNA repair protein alkB homolog 8 [Halyomorpha halys]|uniref:alkylated DNA repair protein alkB homolog 8 n=1 Tax=Halyomorpha halys TaxID=286706 RepID=UPI0006D524D7|nr:alkylated DNA repair protein alkB homolog 8 [Halyomorpha halys]
MSTFMDRKKWKKTKKYSNILLKDLEIKVTSEPKTNLVLCNAGLLTGISEEDVVNYFGHYGQIDNVVMVPKKSYCFIVFRDLDSAIDCFASMTLPSVSSLSKDPLYILYVEDVPSKHDLYKNYSCIPPGVIIVENFISEIEELLLSNSFDVKDNSGQELSHRMVKHFGYEFDYSTNNVNKNSPLPEGVPEEFNFLKERFHENNLNNLITWFPNQLTVNCYLPGQGIPPHVDTHSAFEDPILSLSLLSDVVMEFEKCDKQNKASVLIPRRSLLIISGEARYYWTHGIIPRKSDVVYDAVIGLCTKSREKRISCTFRKIRTGNCYCNYSIACDSYLSSHTQTPTEEAAARIENEFVHKVYENISDHFSSTRHSPWPAVRNFLKSLTFGSIVVDIGCGNGKYFDVNSYNFHFGGDSCNKLNLICADKGMEVFQFNCLNVPLKDNVADAVICIAVLHHLSKESRRIQALKEIFRILKVGGLALIYVWSKKQNSTSYVGKNANNVNKSNFSPTINKYKDKSGIVLPIHCNKTEFQHIDVLVPWTLRLKNVEETQYLRYYHLFEETELEKMCTEIGGEIVKSYYDDGNWCVLFKKS